MNWCHSLILGIWFSFSCSSSKALCLSAQRLFFITLFLSLFLVFEFIVVQPNKCYWIFLTWLILFAIVKLPLLLHIVMWCVLHSLPSSPSFPFPFPCPLWLFRSHLPFLCRLAFPSPFPILRLFSFAFLNPPQLHSNGSFTTLPCLLPASFLLNALWNNRIDWSLIYSFQLDSDIQVFKSFFQILRYLL